MTILEAAAQLKDTAEDLQIAAVRLSHAGTETVEHQAALYRRKWRAHNKAMEDYEEAIKGQAE